MTKNILVTGSAGFIGFHLCKKLLNLGFDVIGIDNLNDYYSRELKEKRNEILLKYRNYEFIKDNICHYNTIRKKIPRKKIDVIVHLAAQPGVRRSIDDPQIYVNSNVLGTVNIFDIAKENKIPKVVFASSSSVYGNNKKIPFREEDRVDHPLSIYASTKRSTELIAYNYHHLFGINMIGLRFFTVYGEFGRPDMAAFKFVRDILLGKKIKVFNRGNMKRDFTYISDAVKGIELAMEKDFGYEIFNIGNSNPVKLDHFIKLLEKKLKTNAKREMLPMQPGDIEETCADIRKAVSKLGYSPKVGIEEGLGRFCKWFLENSEWALKIQ